MFLARKSIEICFLCGILLSLNYADNETTTFFKQHSSEDLSFPMTTGTPRGTESPSVVVNTNGKVHTSEIFSTESTTVTAVVRHNFGRGLPVPHYHLSDSRWGPFFEEGSDPHNLTARIGSTVLLDCRIGLLQDKTVSWLHHKGEFIHLLTVGRSAYSRDERITLSFRYPNNYRLQIVYVTHRDQGLYECQVATHPPKVKRVFLKVSAPEVRIVDESGREVTERYYKAGSGLELTCQAKQVEGITNHFPITWKHGDHTLSKGISTNTSTSSATKITSLKIASLDKSDSGNYTCSVEALGHVTVAVHVLNGELPAAVHHGEAVCLSMFTNYISISTVILCILSSR